MEPVIGLGGVGLGKLVLQEKDVAVEEKVVLPVEVLVLPVEEEVLGLPIEGLAGEEDPVERGCPEIIATCVDYLEASPWEEAEHKDILKIILGWVL
uniref:Uncharacterized protein n=1 Tax=Tanacetum cinerariifolium TaxID=118510 RepID=A0A699IIS1_TANCI|nr:hypothetical protein [Tanacetum cinerariifolium]